MVHAIFQTPNFIFGISTEVREVKGRTNHVVRVTNMDTLKIVFYEGYQNEQGMLKRIQDWKCGVAEKECDKITVKQIKSELVNPFQIGQIFYHSWGWEQTNIDFYQVVAIKPKSVVVRRIAEEVERYSGDMAEYVLPVKDKFVSDDLTTLRLTVQVNELFNNGKPRIYVNAPTSYGCMCEFENKSLYQSHYA